MHPTKHQKQSKNTSLDAKPSILQDKNKPGTALSVLEQLRTSGHTNENWLSDVSPPIQARMKMFTAK